MTGGSATVDAVLSMRPLKLEEVAVTVVSKTEEKVTEAPAAALHVPVHSPLHAPEHSRDGASARAVHVPEQVPRHVPSAWRPEPVPPAASAAHVPSHLPSHFTATPPFAVHDPLHCAVQEPSHFTVAVASALHSPLHEMLSEPGPPEHVGGSALTSHLALPEHFAWQFAFALNEAAHFGGFTSSARETPAVALADAIACAAAVHHDFICSFLSV